MKRIALCGLFVLAISVPGSVVGDRALDTYPKNPDIDIEHYAFQIVLSDATDLIRGIASIDARFSRPGIRPFGSISSKLRAPWTVAAWPLTQL